MGGAEAVGAHVEAKALSHMGWGVEPGVIELLYDS